MRGATDGSPAQYFGGDHFNPRAPCGARPQICAPTSVCIGFQSTRPMRGATFWFYDAIKGWPYFNPRAPCGARQVQKVLKLILPDISIHAPHAGRDLLSHSGVAFFCRFQSTRPMRGATLHAQSDHQQERDFNPRAPCGARHRPQHLPAAESTISIHAPHAGRDKSAAVYYGAA